ncbi:hypothetical protein EV426DRAFT_39589 [Tirmania nivea]|nr:hypothetical protein EV426DRAFT_39589 [Tirmania nivea]
MKNLRSIQSRTRPHLVYGAKRHIAKLYKFDQNCSPDYVRKRVSELLDRDRFMCKEEKQKEWGHRFRAIEGVQFIHMNYFDSPKKLGNQDRTFISRITGSFMYLIFATLQHALLTYKSRVFKDGDNFNYTNSAVAFGRMREQWGDFPTTLEQSLLKIIRMGIVWRCQQHGKVTQWEQPESYKMERIELEEYTDELAADIKDAEDASWVLPPRTPNWA